MTRKIAPSPKTVDQFLASLEIGNRFYLDDLVSHLAQKREKRLIFLPVRLPADLYGAWISTATTDYVFFEENTTTIHQVAIKLHEIAHMLYGHTPHISGDETIVQASLHGQLDENTCSLLLRNKYNQQEEREAERLATRLMNRLIWNLEDELFDHDLTLNQHVTKYARQLNVL